MGSSSQDLASALLVIFRQIHQWQAQKLARDFQQKSYQGKQLGLEEENCFWWCRFSWWSNQKRHSGGCQSQTFKEEVKNWFCRGWCWSFERKVLYICLWMVSLDLSHCLSTCQCFCFRSQNCSVILANQIVSFLVHTLQWQRGACVSRTELRWLL